LKGKLVRSIEITCDLFSALENSRVNKACVGGIHGEIELRSEGLVNNGVVKCTGLM
jgi:hypothetical protein